MKFMAAALIGLCSIAALAQETSDPAAQQVERQQTQPLNNAPVWRAVRSGAPAETAVIGRETNVLIQPTMKLPGLPAVSAGEAWRPARPPLSTAGGGLNSASLLALARLFPRGAAEGGAWHPAGRSVPGLFTARARR